MLKRAVHPGVILKDELEELGVLPTAFARQIEVTPNRISQIIAGKRSVTGDTALRLGQWFGIDPQFWMNLQAQFDLATAERQVGETVRALPTASQDPVKSEGDGPDKKLPGREHLGKWLIENAPPGANLEVPRERQSGRAIPFVD